MYCCSCEVYPHLVLLGSLSTYPIRPGHCGMSFSRVSGDPYPDKDERAEVSFVSAALFIRNTPILYPVDHFLGSCPPCCCRLLVSEPVSHKGRHSRTCHLSLAPFCRLLMSLATLLDGAAVTANLSENNNRVLRQ